MADDEKFTRALDADTEEEGRRASHRYIVHGFEDVGPALLYAKDRIPATYQSAGAGLSLQPLKIDRILIDQYMVEAEYLSAEAVGQENEGGIESVDRISFSTLGGTLKKYQSEKTTPLGTYPQVIGPINVDNDGVAQGVDIYAPKLEFTVISKRLKSEVENGLVGDLHSLTGSVNNDTFLGFSIGELLFLGAEGTTNSSANYVPISYKFAAEPNRYSINIGGFALPAKFGWDYVEIVYGKTKDNNTGRITAYVENVFIHEVYEYRNFNGLGINL